MTSVSLPIQHQRYLPSPCNNSLAVTNINAKTRKLLIDLGKFLSLFSKRYGVLEESSKIELSVLSKFLYKNHNRFRNDKAHKFLKMMQKCCDRFWNELSLGQEVTKFYGVYPITMDIQNKDKVYLPTKEMLKYLLARLYGGANLLWKIITYSHHAGELCVQRIKLGHFWNIGLNNLSCISRIWALTISSIILVENAYKNLILLLPVFPAHSRGLPVESDELPLNIAEVISQNDCISFMEKFNKFVNIDKLPEFVHDLKMSEVVVGQIEKGLSIDAGTIICRSENIANSQSTELSTDSQQSPVTTSNTLEIQDSNEILEGKSLPCSYKKWKKLNSLISSYTKNVEALQSFVLEENKLRKTSRATSLTKMLGQDQWKALRNKLNILIDTCTSGDVKKKSIKILGKSKNLLLCWILYPNLKGMKPANWKQIEAHFEKEI